MGNQRFKLSDMIPNAWFYKLKDNATKSSKSQPTKHNKDHHSPPPAPTSTIKITDCPHPQVSNPDPRKSYHIKRELNLIDPLAQEQDFHPITPPRRSKSSSKSRKSSRRTNSLSPSSCKSTTTFQSYRSKSNSTSSPPLFEDALRKTEHKTEDYDTVTVTITDVDSAPLYGDISTFNFKLPPIITKQDANPPNCSVKEKTIAPILKEQLISPPPRNRGVRLKVNSPRIMGRKQGQNGNSGRKSLSSKRRSFSESFAVVKSSFDPHRDFKESMVEMIVQNNLRAPKDLEDLLACYLSLNSDEYHDVIIKVFKQIWFDIRRHR